MPGMNRVHVIDHPLVKHKLSLLRDIDTAHGDFRRICRELTVLVIYEATADLPLTEIAISTPMTETTVMRLRRPEPAVVAILRAGLIMAEATIDLIPHAAVGHIGMYRDPDTHEPVDYYAKLPDRLGDRAVFLVDPMLATGGSAVNALNTLKEAGATDIRLLCIVGCPEGVSAVQAEHPDVSLFLAAMDSGLDESDYIVPGLGDAGDRIFGTQ